MTIDEVLKISNEKGILEGWAIIVNGGFYQVQSMMSFPMIDEQADASARSYGISVNSDGFVLNDKGKKFKA